ncbi:hypothetical protein G7Y89_g2763 [Cudoniella acicularis]|uniref:Uncharacterized protein n=1 Tax=Cudoniella acicularis TaxID=354080 RepID=A0A8H4RSR0_9HELO|nr:hypothetical protein G7Y89_g2763 [Cudoniella acicularis]
MFSPPRREKARVQDDSLLPQGDCRYILLHPEYKGLRCACVRFALNRAVPGSMCDCGHQACYHTPDTGAVERQELDALKAKITLLEEELDRERHGGRGGLVDRLGRLEELVEKIKGEHDAEFKAVYRGIGGLWHNVGALNKRLPYYDDRIEGLVDDIHRMDQRLIDVDDASMRVEERVDVLERSKARDETPISRRRKASTPPSLRDVFTKTERRSQSFDDEGGMSPGSSMTDDTSHIQLFREKVASVGSDPRAWTVHVSLLPTSSQPFPFEKDTAAYKRCLSRGLHQMIVIPDSDSHSFQTAVNHAFSKILLGRVWEPLVARICDAKNLRGLPMLRQLLGDLIGHDYDVKFLRDNCAVVDETGKILDLYIAMSDDTLSWAELKDVTPFTEGLEGSWKYDQLLDGPCRETDGSKSRATGQDNMEKRPAAGDIVPTWSPSLKRRASSSFGSASTDGDGTRAKIRRQMTSASVEVVGWRTEAV